MAVCSSLMAPSFLVVRHSQSLIIAALCHQGRDWFQVEVVVQLQSTICAGGATSWMAVAESSHGSSYYTHTARASRRRHQCRSRSPLRRFCVPFYIGDQCTSWAPERLFCRAYVKQYQRLQASSYLNVTYTSWRRAHRRSYMRYHSDVSQLTISNCRTRLTIRKAIVLANIHEVPRDKILAMSVVKKRCTKILCVWRVLFFFSFLCSFSCSTACLHTCTRSELA